MVAATGTNTPGFFLWTLALTIVGWLASVGDAYLKFSGQHIPNPLARSVQDSWFAGAFVLLGAVILLVLAWGISTVVVIYREHEASKAELERIKGIVTPLQFEGFELAADIRAFMNECGPLGPLPAEEQKYRTSVQEHLSNLVDSYARERDVSIQMKVSNGFKVNGLEKRVEDFICKAGMQIPAGSHVFREGISDRRGLALLARDMEEISLAIKYLHRELEVIRERKS
jgi:hypothetical protein